MNPIQNAISQVGGVTNLARALGVTPQAVCFWRDGKRKIPAEKCSAVELATAGATSRKDLRPDDWREIWPELASAIVSQPQPAAQAGAEQGG
jgi:DNA-binding transcriptional regulator YdaS (Cro superfamily)